MLPFIFVNNNSHKYKYNQERLLSYFYFGTLKYFPHNLAV